MSNSNNRNILKSSFATALATFLSRILGLVRVMLEARVLGGGAFAGAWYLAFSIPNLFRRLLGEGAMGNALIPLIIQQEEKFGKEQIRKDLAVIFSILTLVFSFVAIFIALISLLIRFLSATSWVIENFPLLATERIQLVLNILPILMPYTVFICLIGLIGAVLNSRKIFFLPALGALSLNVFIISALAIAYFFYNNSVNLERFLYILSYMVLLSGAFQLILVAILLHFYGVFPKLELKSIKNLFIVGQLFKLALPGMIGAAALQISFLIDELLAISLGPQAIPALANVSRIIDLPIGIFAISFGSVIMSNLSHSAKNNDIKSLNETLVFGIKHVSFLSIPMGMAIVFFHEEILRAIFLGGNYTTDDLNATKLVAIIYGFGIPVFCTMKILPTAFLSRKIMKKPLYSSLIAISCNIVLNIILMQFLAQAGIALATVVSSIINCSILLIMLHKEKIHLGIKSLIVSTVRNFALATVASLIVFFLYKKIIPCFETNKIIEISSLILALFFMGLIFLFLSWILKVKECREIMEIFYKRTKKIV